MFNRVVRRWISSTKSDLLKGEGVVKIGAVTAKRNRQIREDSPFSPRNYFLSDGTSSMTPSIIRHLQWMLQKDALGQDMLLIGPPGAGEVFRRRLALAFCDLLQRETQIVSLTQDTTESDLKQRRELVRSDPTSSSTSLDMEFVDQPPVSAAINGRFLILDGLEKAERNVLPTLNNLLEHREMHLEDGRFLVSPSRYELLMSNSSTHVNELVPTSKDFRVIALAVPNPPYSSSARSIDPPLRSRFQIRRIDPLPSSEILSLLEQNDHNHDHDHITALATLAGTIDTVASQNVQVRPFPVHMATTTKTSGLGIAEILNIYAVAHSKWGNEASQKALTTAWNKAMGSSKSTTPNRLVVERIDRLKKDGGQMASVTISSIGDDDPDKKLMFTVPCGDAMQQEHEESGRGGDQYVLTTSMQDVFASMVQQHQSHDILLISPAGEGKSAMANYFARRLGYQNKVYLVQLFPEMTARDLLLRRATCPDTGETIWQDSELVKCIRSGGLCILDGIDKLRPNILSSLQSLCVDRDIFLPDGRRMFRVGKDSTDSNNDDAAIQIHPSFRIVALASPSENKSDGTCAFLDEAMGMFATISITHDSFDESCTKDILMATKHPDCSEESVDKLLHLRNCLTADLADDCGVSPLSTRNLIRVARRVHSHEDLSRVLLQNIFVADLLPPSQRAALERIMEDCGISIGTSLLSRYRRSKLSRRPDAADTMKVEVDENTCTIGNFTMERKEVIRPAMIPAPKFFDIPYHIEIIRDLLMDWKQGERAFLLLGNQGKTEQAVFCLTP
jgi:MoxR-like ATPase